MAEPEQKKNDKEEASAKRREPLEYRRFKRLLRQAVNTPALRNTKTDKKSN